MASVRFARTMRWAMVGSGARNARAISVGRQATQHPERESHARFGGEHRMARGEDKTQKVVPHIVVQCAVELGHAVRSPDSSS